MVDLELRHLSTLTAVVEEGSFGRAASRLGYTQSTVSQHIATLERAVHGRIFDRPGGPRRVRLTPLGQVIVSHAAELLDRADALDTAVERFKAGEGRLTIGTFQSISNTVLPDLISRLRSEFPGCDLRLSEDEADLPDLSKVDLLFYDHRIEDPDVEHVKLLDDPYCLVAPRGRFADGPVRLADLDSEPMVAWPPDCAQPTVQEALAKGGVHPEVVFRATGNETIFSMVRAGLGSAIVPYLPIHAAAARDDEALSLHDLRPPLAPREIFVVRQAHRTPSPLAAHAARLAVEIARKFESDVRG